MSGHSNGQVTYPLVGLVIMNSNSYGQGKSSCWCGHHMSGHSNGQVTYPHVGLVIMSSNSYGQETSSCWCSHHMSSHSNGQVTYPHVGLVIMSSNSYGQETSSCWCSHHGWSLKWLRDIHSRWAGHHISGLSSSQVAVYGKCYRWSGGAALSTQSHLTTCYASRHYKKTGRVSSAEGIGGAVVPHICVIKSNQLHVHGHSVDQAHGVICVAVLCSKKVKRVLSGE